MSRPGMNGFSLGGSNLSQPQGSQEASRNSQFGSMENGFFNTSALSIEPSPLRVRGNRGMSHKLGNRRPASNLPSRGQPDSIHRMEDRAHSGYVGGSSEVVVIRGNNNAERIVLDSHELTACPVFRQIQEDVRMLNLQHNQISRIENLRPFTHLIFLDLYDNQIERLDGLQEVPSLRVLMLGKNRIRRIEKLHFTERLDVLDLHANQIECLEGLSALIHLRVLNLAGNKLRILENLQDLNNLVELNVRRNKIDCIKVLPASLQRLFLSFNCLASLDDIHVLESIPGLYEVSLDNNPLCDIHQYKQIILSRLAALKQLDSRRVTEEERRVSIVTLKRQEEKRKEQHRSALKKQKKLVAIENARKEWQRDKSDLVASYIATVNTSPSSSVEPVEDASRALSGKKRGADSQISSCVEGNDFLAEIVGDELHLFGAGSLSTVDHNWGIQAAGTVTSAHFKFVEWSKLAPQLPRLLARFPALRSLQFECTNLSGFAQLNGLGAMRLLDCLIVREDGNSIYKLKLWQTYALFRLAHCSLKEINGHQIGASDIVHAEKLFGTLARVGETELPRFRLTCLLGEMRRKRLERNAAGSSDETLGRAVLTERMHHSARKSFCHSYAMDIVRQAARTKFKTQRLEAIWEDVLTDMINKVLGSFENNNAYSKDVLKKMEQDLSD